jgi:hypothetical protein
MNDQHFNKAGQCRRSLDQRLADNPELAEAFHLLIDEMDQSLSEDASADDVEERVRAGVRKVGHEALTHWAEQAQAKASQNVSGQNPDAVRHAKKNSAGKPSSGPSKSRSRSGG